MLPHDSASASSPCPTNDSPSDVQPFSHKCASHRHAGHFLLVTAGRSCWALPSLLRHAQVHARATSNGRDGTQMGQGPAGLASRPWRSQQPVRRRTIWRACCGRHRTRSSSRRRPPRGRRWASSSGRRSRRTPDASSWRRQQRGEAAAQERFQLLVQQAAMGAAAQVRRLGNQLDIPLVVAARSLSWLMTMARSKQQWKGGAAAPPPPPLHRTTTTRLLNLDLACIQL